MIASPLAVNFAFMNDKDSSKGENLANILKSRDVRAADLARAAGVSPQTVNNWLKRGVSAEYALIAAEFLICDPSAISNIQPAANMQTTKPAPSMESIELVPVDLSMGKVPLISSVQAGNWCEAIDNFHPGDAEEWLPCPARHSRHAYALRVTGSSMEPRFREGEIILVDPEEPAIHGSDVVVRAPDGNATFKRLQITQDGTFLLALNPDWKPRIIEIPPDSRICGVVIESRIARRKR